MGGTPAFRTNISNLLKFPFSPLFVAIDVIVSSHRFFFKDFFEPFERDRAPIEKQVE